jgi:2-iminobutanoate/2-iminopropanoate deaminase
MREEILTDKGPQPRGPYSQAIVADGRTVYVSGQGPVDPQTNQLEFGTFAQQAKLVFDNIGAILEAAGTSWKHVVRVGVFLSSLEDFAEMNEIYLQYLSQPYPARTTVEAGLPAQMRIEVDCIAVVPEG